MRSPSLPVGLAAVLALAACADRPSVVGDAPDPAVISGTVQGRAGPEAGVWVVAETDELATGFAKIVATDEEGRFVLPELPDAAYDVWVRGYGLADSDPFRAERGQDLMLVAEYPETLQEEASIYPGNYWYSLMEVPAADEFPGLGGEGNGIAPSMRTQAHWIDDLKQGCQLCHQLGNQATRGIEHLEGRYASTLDAWQQRTLFGQRGGTDERGHRRDGSAGRGGVRGMDGPDRWPERFRPARPARRARSESSS